VVPIRLSRFVEDNSKHGLASLIGHSLAGLCRTVAMIATHVLCLLYGSVVISYCACYHFISVCTDYVCSYLYWLTVPDGRGPLGLSRSHCRPIRPFRGTVAHEKPWSAIATILRFVYLTTSICHFLL
jgi:hypothetical protein